MDSSEIFLDLEQNVLVKLEQTETSDADFIIPFYCGRKNNKNDDCCSETTNESP